MQSISVFLVVACLHAMIQGLSGEGYPKVRENWDCSKIRENLVIPIKGFFKYGDLQTEDLTNKSVKQLYNLYEKGYINYTYRMNEITLTKKQLEVLLRNIRKPAEKCFNMPAKMPAVRG